MHWSNIFTVVATLVVGAAGYVGGLRGVSKGVTDAQQARSEQATLEHRRWLRDRRVDVYLACVEFAAARAASRTAMVDGQADPPADSAEPDTALRSRLVLFGSADSLRQFRLAATAHAEVVQRHRRVAEQTERIRTGSVGFVSLDAERAEIQRFMDAANEADRVLVDTIVLETQQPLNAARQPLVPIPAPREHTP
jgi:hypothetical protein